jgi:1,2-phenylacetyl-CoA epoxidase catalytic subunit
MDYVAWADVMESLADNKFVLGDQLVEIGVSAPELQSALASVALAQAELGHARHLYNWVGEWRGEEIEITEESGNSLPALALNRNWIDLMVSVLAVNTAAKLVIDEIRRGGDRAVVAKTSKMLVEIEEHRTFAREWCRRFASEDGAVPRVFCEARERLVGAIDEWLGAADKRLSTGRSLELVRKFYEEMEAACPVPSRSLI